MEILNKYKFDFDNGFKNFVMDLNLLPPKDVQELVFNGLLEDPVYIKWALENKLTCDYFVKLNSNDVLKVFRKLQNAELMFLYALKNHMSEAEFIQSNFPKFIRDHYFILREAEKVTVSLQMEARGKILQTIFDLMESGVLDPFDWKMPPSEVLAGISHTLDYSGNFKQFYADGVLALQGWLDDRTKRCGEWRSYYPSGAIHTIGNYDKGRKQGEWIFYYLSGEIKSRGQFLNNVKDGEWMVFEMRSECKIVTYTNGKISF
jgi:hypothetical protein